MVHYKPILKGLRTEPYDRKYHRKYQKDTYWMLGFYLDKSVGELKEYLKTHGYLNRYNTGSTKAVLLDAIGRYQRGLLSYGRYSTKKLREFCHARALRTPKAAETSQLVRILENADDTATFPRFFQLPAELRIRIYEFHFSDYDDMSTQHRQPPLTLIPRIRAEALPIFYGCVTFAWDLSISQSWAVERHQFVGGSYELLQMPATNLARIKNFKIHFTRIGDGYGGGIWRHLRFSMHFSQRNSVTKAFAVVWPGTASDPRARDLEKGVRELLLKTGYSEATWQLRHGYLLDIEKLMNRIMPPPKRTRRGRG